MTAGTLRVLDAASRLRQRFRLCGYIYDLARDFTTFYETCPVLGADEPTRNNRLGLCQLTAGTLDHGLGLLGITAPERM